MFTMRWKIKMLITISSDSSYFWLLILAQNLEKQPRSVEHKCRTVSAKLFILMLLADGCLWIHFEKVSIWNHWVKSVHIWCNSGPHFPAFGMNTVRYWVFLRIQSERGKIRTRMTQNTHTSHTVNALVIWLFRFQRIFIF